MFLLVRSGKRFDPCKFGRRVLTNDSASSTHPAIGRAFTGELRIVWEDTRTRHPEIWIKRKVPKGNSGPDQCRCNLLTGAPCEKVQLIRGGDEMKRPGRNLPGLCSNR